MADKQAAITETLDAMLAMVPNLRIIPSYQGWYGVVFEIPGVGCYDLPASYRTEREAKIGALEYFIRAAANVER